MIQTCKFRKGNYWQAGHSTLPFLGAPCHLSECPLSFLNALPFYAVSRMVPSNTEVLLHRLQYDSRV